MQNYKHIEKTALKKGDFFDVFIEGIAKLPGSAKSPFWRLLPPFLLVYPTRILPRRKGMGCSKAAATLAKSTKIIDFSLAGSFAIPSIALQFPLLNRLDEETGHEGAVVGVARDEAVEEDVETSFCMF